MKPTTIDCDGYHHPTFHIEPLQEYKDYDSDEEMAYETAFGTTICDGDYMQQYQKHNRIHSNLNPMLLTSPSFLKSPAKSNNTASTITANVEDREHPIFLNVSTKANKHVSKAVTVDPIPSPTQMLKDISAKSIGTTAPIHDNNHTHNVQTDGTNTKVPNFITKFKTFPFGLNQNEDFEPQQLEYGQSALYDKNSQQYFANLESDGDKRYVLINLQYDSDS